MLTRRLRRGAVLAAWALASCSPRVVAQSAPGPPVETAGAASAPASALGDLGTFHRAITTSSDSLLERVNANEWQVGMRFSHGVVVAEQVVEHQEAAGVRPTGRCQ